MTETVRAGNLITLHYRVATGDDTELVSTFDSTPATLQLGSGELAPPLEHCLIGVNVGERHVFLLEPDQAFRRSVVALARSLPSLSKDETRELTGLTTATYAGVPWADRSRLASYIERVRKSATTRPEEDREMAALLKTAEERLTPARRLRLQAYYEKAIRAEH